MPPQQHPRLAAPSYWQPPFGGPYGPQAQYGGQYGAWSAPRPPAKSSTGVVLLVILIVILLLIVLGTALIYAAGDGRTDIGSGPTVTVTRSTDETAQTTTSTPGPTSSTTTALTTTALTTTAGATPTRTTSSSTPTGTAALQGNPLFADPAAGLASQRCNADGWPANSQAGRRFFDSLSPCLDRAWGRAVTAAGLTYRPPTAILVPAGGVISSPCGSVDLGSENVAAFYCPGNETLYMPPQGLQVDRYGDQPVIYLSVFAHEYGHHVQLVTGISRAQRRIELAAGTDSDSGLESSRRLELEAQCFAGLFLRSISDTGGQFTRANDYRIAYEDQERGDPPGELRTHGTSDHAQSWWDGGYQGGRTAQCNTWAASAGDVA